MKKFIVIVVIVYLIVSGLLVLMFIDFEEPPSLVLPAYSEEYNIFRNLIGLPSIYNSYGGVSPIYLVQVAIKFIIATILIKFYKRILKNNKINKED